MNFGDEKNGNGNKNNENYGENNNNGSNNGYQINNQNRNKNNENNSNNNNNNNNDENMIKDIYLSGGVLLCILEILPFNIENSFILAMKCVLNETNNNIIIDTNMIMNNIKDNALNKNKLESINEDDNNKENKNNNKENYNENQNQNNNENNKNDKNNNNNNEENHLNIILKNNKKRANYVKSISQGYIGLSKITARINENVLEESFSLILGGATAEPAGR